MIKAVLFDMDGTIVNTERHYVDGTVDYLKKQGIDADYHDVARIIGTTMDVTYDILNEISGLSYEKLTELNDHYFEVENPVDYKKLLFKDTLPCFSDLKKMGVKIAICSMSDTVYVERCIKQIGLEDYVDYYLGATSVTKPKPDPEVYLKAIETLKLSKEEVIIVEDAAQGILAGKNAGIYTIARRDYQFGIDQSKADLIVDDLSYIKEVVKNG